MPKGSDGLLICVQIQFCLLGTKPFHHFSVNKPVLGSDLCSGTGGDTGTDGIGFCHNAVDSGLFQGMGAENPGHSSANDQHIGFGVPLQAGKPGKGNVSPDG